MKAWHFTGIDKKLQYNDNRTVILGKTITVDCEPKLCGVGLHGSTRIIDALQYAPGPVVWKVDIGGKVIKGDDKIVGTERTAIAGGIDITDILREFSRWYALQNVEKIKPYCNNKKYDLIIKWLKTGDEKLMDNVYAITHSIAYYTANSIVRHTINADVHSAANSVAHSADYYAVHAACLAADPDAYSTSSFTNSADSSAAIKKYNTKLTRMVNKVLEDTK